MPAASDWKDLQNLFAFFLLPTSTFFFFLPVITLGVKKNEKLWLSYTEAFTLTYG